MGFCRVLACSCTLTGFFLLIFELILFKIGSPDDSCIYHNTNAAVSLYEDHCCGKDQIPTNTIQILTEHQNEVWFVQFSNTGMYFASSSSDCITIIWQVLEDDTLTLKHTLRSHQNLVSFVAWSPDDKKLLTYGNAEVMKLWDVGTGTCKHTFGDHGFTISSCAWFPDSKGTAFAWPTKHVIFTDYHGK